MTPSSSSSRRWTSHCSKVANSSRKKPAIVSTRPRAKQRRMQGNSAMPTCTLMRPQLPLSLLPTRLNWLLYFCQLPHWQSYHCLCHPVINPCHLVHTTSEAHYGPPAFPQTKGAISLTHCLCVIPTIKMVRCLDKIANHNSHVYAPYVNIGDYDFTPPQSFLPTMRPMRKAKLSISSCCSSQSLLASMFPLTYENTMINDDTTLLFQLHPEPLPASLMPIDDEDIVSIHSGQAEAGEFYTNAEAFYEKGNTIQRVLQPWWQCWGEWVHFSFILPTFYRCWCAIPLFTTICRLYSIISAHLPPHIPCAILVTTTPLKIKVKCANRMDMRRSGSSTQGLLPTSPTTLTQLSSINLMQSHNTLRWRMA